MEQAESVLIPIHAGSLDLSITCAVVWIFVASALLVLALLLAVRKLSLVPVRPLQNILEYSIEFVEQQIVEPAELDRAVWTPFFFTLFLFILFNNLIGIIPGTHATTSNINETGALAILVFVIGNFLRIFHKGVLGFMKSLVPEGVKGPILIIMFPIEVVSQLVKPFSLAIRLFANMTGGHLLLVTAIGFVVIFQNVAIGIISIGGSVVIALFELFVDVIQAYIFAFLSAMLVSECLEERHGGLE